MLVQSRNRRLPNRPLGRTGVVTRIRLYSRTRRLGESRRGQLLPRRRRRRPGRPCRDNEMAIISHGPQTLLFSPWFYFFNFFFNSLFFFYFFVLLVSD